MKGTPSSITSAPPSWMTRKVGDGKPDETRVAIQNDCLDIMRVGGQGQAALHDVRNPTIVYQPEESVGHSLTLWLRVSRDQKQTCTSWVMMIAFACSYNAHLEGMHNTPRYNKKRSRTVRNVRGRRDRRAPKQGHMRKSNNGKMSNHGQ